MNLSKMKTAALFLVALSLLFAGQSMAGVTKKSQSKSAKLQQSYVWYDGEQERQVWLNPDLMAEFGAGKGSAAKSSVKSVYADAVQVPKRFGSVNIWRLGAGTGSDAAIAKLSTAGQPGKYSPVLHDGPSSTGRMRALPGNIIVYLDPAWNNESVNAWAAGHQFEIVKKLEIGPNIYVIRTGPGLEALNIANTLYKSGEVVAAFPDWWEEKTTR